MKKLVGSLLLLLAGAGVCRAGILHVVETNFTTQPLTKVLYLRCNNPYYYAKTNADSTYTANFLNVVAGTNQLELKRPSGSFVYSFVIPDGLAQDEVVDAYTLYSGLPPAPVVGTPWTNWAGLWVSDARATNQVTTKSLNVIGIGVISTLQLTNPSAVDTPGYARLLLDDSGYVHINLPVQICDNIFLNADGSLSGVGLWIAGSGFFGGDLTVTNGSIFIRAGGLVIGSGTFSITNEESVATFVESGTNVLRLTTNAITALVPLYGSGEGVTNIPTSSLNAVGARTSSTFLRGDGVWTAPTGPGGLTNAFSETYSTNYYWWNGATWVLLTNLVVATATNSGFVSSNHSARLSTVTRSSPCEKPPMGWNSYYDGGIANTSSNSVALRALMLLTNGMHSLGYRYMVIDEGWGLTTRAAVTEELQVDPAKYPGGDLAGLSRFLHTNGFLFGLYHETGDGALSSGSSQVTMKDHYEQDAATIAKWGVDYFKIDGMATVPTGRENYVRRFLDAYTAVSNKTAVVELGLVPSTYGTWMQEVVNFWRPSGLGDAGNSVSVFYDWIDFIYPFRGWFRKGSWPYLDILIGSSYGGSGATEVGTRTHVGLSALWSCPLFIGAPDQYGGKYYTNKEIIAIDQDVDAMVMAERTYTNNSQEVWVKKLTDGSLAVGLHNRTTNAGTYTNITAYWTNIGLTADTIATVRDVWARSIVAYCTGSFSTNVATMALEVLKITPGKVLPFPYGTNYLSCNYWMPAYTNAIRLDPYNDYEFPIYRDVAPDGTALELNGVTYTNGLSIYPYANFSYFVGGQATRFHFSFGIDDMVSSGGSAKVQVYADGVLIGETTTNTSASATFTTNLNVNGAQVITIVAVDTSADHMDSNNRVDIVDAYFVCPEYPVLLTAGSPAPNFEIPYSTYTTNGVMTFLDPINAYSGVPQTAVIFVTNSTASAVAATPPAKVHTQGTWYITNVTAFTFFNCGGLWTNAIAFPLW